MSKSDNERYINPIASTAGLVLAFLAAITPLFTEARLTSFFIDSAMIAPSVIATVLLGIIVTWLILDHHAYVNIPLPKTKTEQRPYGKNLYTQHIIWISTPIILALFYLFFTPLNAPVQAIVFIAFFIFLIADFALLLSNARSRDGYLSQKQSLPFQIVSTLEKNGIINTGVKIVRNTPVTQKVLDDNNIEGVMYGALHIIIVDREGNEINTLFSSDGKEFIAELKK